MDNLCFDNLCQIIYVLWFRRQDCVSSCVRYMPTSRRRAADSALHRHYLILRDHARHTGRTWQPQGEDLNFAVL